MSENYKKCRLCSSTLSSRSKALCEKHLQMQREQAKKLYNKRKLDPKWIENKNSKNRLLYRKNNLKIRLQKNANTKKLHDDAWKKCIEYYSNGVPQCACCKEENPLFLTVDHIDGVSKRYPRELRGKRLLRRLVYDKFPSDFQIYCENCNYAKFRLGKCPHQLSKIN